MVLMGFSFQEFIAVQEIVFVFSQVEKMYRRTVFFNRKINQSSHHYVGALIERIIRMNQNAPPGSRCERYCDYQFGIIAQTGALKSPCPFPVKDIFPVRIKLNIRCNCSNNPVFFSKYYVTRIPGGMTAHAPWFFKRLKKFIFQKRIFSVNDIVIEILIYWPNGIVNINIIATFCFWFSSRHWRY